MEGVDVVCVEMRDGRGHWYIGSARLLNRGRRMEPTRGIRGVTRRFRGTTWSGNLVVRLKPPAILRTLVDDNREK